MCICMRDVVRCGTCSLVVCVPRDDDDSLEMYLDAWARIITKYS